MKRRSGLLVLCLFAGCAATGAVDSGAPDVVADVASTAEPAQPTGAQVMNANFETRVPGIYAADMLVDDFGGGPTWNNGLDEGRATIVEEAGGHFLRVTYPAGKVGPKDAGVQFMVSFLGNHDELYLAYRIRFGAGFQFVKGGKLPGLVGGTAPTGCGLDAAEIAGGFSARGMWRSAGAPVQLMYTATMAGTCGDDFPWAAHFVPGQWQKVVHHVRLNTPGQANGIMEAWLDDRLVLSRGDVMFRGPGASFHIDSLYFSTFFGGSDATWAPSSDQTIDFDDFVITAP